VVAEQTLGIVLRSHLALAMLEDEKSAENRFEPKPKNPFVTAAKWLYGLGYVAVGTFIYYVYQASRTGGPGFPLDWLINPIRHWMGYK
jgi:hypothetical protein